MNGSSTDFQFKTGTSATSNLADCRARPSAPELPADAVRAHDAGRRLPDVALKHVTPRHQGKIPCPLDDREAPAFEIDPARDDALDPFADPGRLEAFAKTWADPLTGLVQFALTKAVDRTVAIPECRTLTVGKLLFDQPLPPRRQSRPNLAPETDIADGALAAFGKLPVEPGRRTFDGKVGDRGA